MNRAALLAAYRADARDLAEPYLAEDADVHTFLNEAQEEAAIRARLIFDNYTAAVTTIAVKAGTRSYPLHASVFEISHAELADESGYSTRVYQISREQLTHNYPNWRQRTERPRTLIHDDNRIELGCTPDRDYTLTLEAYRLPLASMELDTDAPEIAAAHHRKLVLWALYRAFGRPDADLFDPKKSGQALAEFEGYFGLRPDANLRKASRTDEPQHNAPAWL